LSMKSIHDLNGPWVALGGSYPGSLAAWYRLKYPHLVAGSVSTSAPLVAKADFFEYLEVVESALDTTVPGCVKIIKEAVRKTQFLTAHRVGWQMLKKNTIYAPTSMELMPMMLRIFLRHSLETLRELSNTTRTTEHLKEHNG